MLSQDRRPFVHAAFLKPAWPCRRHVRCKSAAGASDLSATQRERWPDGSEL